MTSTTSTTYGADWAVLEASHSDIACRRASQHGAQDRVANAPPRHLSGEA